MADARKAVWISTDDKQRWVKRTPVAGAASPDLAVSGRRHQTIEGFGGCFNELGAIALQAMPAMARKRLLDQLFLPGLGCSFNYCRIPIGSSDFGAQWYSLNEHDGDYAMKHFSIDRDRRIMLPYIKEAVRRQPDMRFFASPWSPPTWLKFPKAYNYGKMRWEKKVLDAYALYFLKFVEAYRKEGVTVHAIHHQNEPVADQKFPSCLWTGAEMRDFIRDHLGPLLAKRSPSTEVWLGTLNVDDYDQYILGVLTDPGAMKYIRGVGLQWWGKAIIQRIQAAWPDVKTIQSENECGDGRNTWDYAMYIYSLLQHYLTNGVVAYVYWNMILQDGGQSTWGWRQNSMVCVNLETGKVTVNPEFHVMKHFSHFVRPGAVRVGLAGPWSGNAVGFENPDGSTVVQLANPLWESRAVTVDLGSSRWKLSLPPRSVHTLSAGE